jgi:transcriptional regulator with XRE-family HTH domain
MSTYSEALKAHFAATEDTEAKLAERVGTSQVSINRYRNGHRFPSGAMARVIDRETAGAVPFATWQAEFMARSGLDA